MTNLQGLDLVLFWVGVGAAVVFPVRYWIGAKWWRNPLGWVLMSLALVILALYAKGVYGLATGVRLHATVSSTAINGVVAALLVALNVVIDYIIRKDKREMNTARERT